MKHAKSKRATNRANGAEMGGGAPVTGQPPPVRIMARRADLEKLWPLGVTTGSTNNFLVMGQSSSSGCCGKLADHEALADMASL